MQAHKTDIILIPAFEPEPTLLPLVEASVNAGFTVVVVDDGSGDGYKEIFRQAENFAYVLTHEKNLGKGIALKTGLSFIMENYGTACIVVTMDADGQHRIEDAIRLRGMARLHPHALILGCRSKLSGKAPLRSRMGNALTRSIYRLVTGCRVYDTQTGLRAFDGAWIETMLAVEGSRYEYEMNVLLYAAKENISILETEIATIYEDGNQTSHFHVLRDSYRIYKEILKFALSSLIGFVVDYGMYVLLLSLTGAFGIASQVSLILANIGARIISGTVNYTINRKLVFRSSASAATSALQYFLLAVFLLGCNTFTLNLLVGEMGVNQYVAKIIVELVFFLVSWIIQKRFVFSSSSWRGTSPRTAHMQVSDGSSPKGRRSI